MSNDSAAPSRLWRLLIAAIAVAGWFWSQSLIGHRPSPAGGVTDQLHRVSAPLHAYLTSHPLATNALLIVTSGFIDFLGLFLLGWGILGPTARPLIALLALFVLRQLCQAVIALPPPEGMIWHYPGIPSLFVTYGVSSDLYFSGHTGIAVLGAVELARLRRPAIAIAGVLIALVEITTVLVLRAHYTMDVFTGLVTALVIADLSLRWAPAVDSWLMPGRERL